MVEVELAQDMSKGVQSGEIRINTRIIACHIPSNQTVTSILFHIAIKPYVVFFVFCYWNKDLWSLLVGVVPCRYMEIPFRSREYKVVLSFTV
jgi:hypothetical protein